MAIMRRVSLLREQAQRLSKRMVHPSRRIVDCRLQIDDLVERARRAYAGLLREYRGRMRVVEEALARCGPLISIKMSHNLVETLNQRIEFGIINLIQTRRTSLQVAVARLETLNPLAVLKRYPKLYRSYYHQGCGTNRDWRTGGCQSCKGRDGLSRGEEMKDAEADF
jgi:exodeoxyribonuclease VII large subunit